MKVWGSVPASSIKPSRSTREALALYGKWGKGGFGGGGIYGSSASSPYPIQD